MTHSSELLPGVREPHEACARDRELVRIVRRGRLLTDLRRIRTLPEEHGPADRHAEPPDDEDVEAGGRTKVGRERGTDERTETFGGLDVRALVVVPGRTP